MANRRARAAQAPQVPFLPDPTDSSDGNISDDAPQSSLGFATENDPVYAGELDPFGGIIPPSTDPNNPFAPINHDSLHHFAAETITRAVTMPAYLLSFVGVLYPDATFVVSRFPPSKNTTSRVSGAALAKFGSLLPETVANQPYIVCLRRRDWPSGAVARMPDTWQARQAVCEMEDVFEKIDGEIWRYKRYAVRATDGGMVSNCLKVVRGYRGPGGPPGQEVVDEWLDAHSGEVEPDEVGARILEHLTYGAEESMSNQNWKSRLQVRQKVERAAARQKVPTLDEDQSTEDVIVATQNVGNTSRRRSGLRSTRSTRRTKAQADSDESDYEQSAAAAAAVKKTAAASRARRALTRVKQEPEH